MYQFVIVYTGRKCAVIVTKHPRKNLVVLSLTYLCHMRAAHNWADAVGGTDWRGWPGPLQAAWQKLEAQRLLGHIERLREPQACRRSMADL